jgi:hypothetical protein
MDAIKEATSAESFVRCQTLNTCEKNREREGNLMHRHLNHPPRHCDYGKLHIARVWRDGEMDIYLYMCTNVFVYTFIAHPQSTLIILHLQTLTKQQHLHFRVIFFCSSSPSSSTSSSFPLLVT